MSESNALHLQTVVDALARCRNLFEEASALQAQYFRSQVPLTVAKLLERVATEAEKAIQNEWAEYVSAPGEASLNVIDIWDAVVRSSGHHLRYLRGSTADRVPGTFSRALDALAAQLELRMQVLLREKWHYNYSVQVEALTESYREELFEALDEGDAKKLFEDLGHPIYAIAFPAIERESVLLHAAFGHEFGHLVAHHWLERDSKDKAVGSAIKQKAAEVIEAKGGGGEPLFETGTTVARITKARTRLLEEYVADAVAIELFGPAALFALASIALSQRSRLDEKPSEHNNFYPSWRERLHLSVKHLETSEWWPLKFSDESNHFEAVVHRIDAIREVARPLSQKAERVNEVAAASELARAKIAEFTDYLRKQVLKNYPPRKSLLEQSEQATRSLARKLPPNDVGSDPLRPTPPALAAILNAGWFYRVGWLEIRGLMPPDKRDQLAVAQRLVLKAIEDVILCADYKVWSSEVPS